jgi:hypothetical protein
MNKLNVIKFPEQEVMFTDTRKTELNLFSLLEESGLPHLNLCQSPPEKILFVWLSIYLFETLMRDCPGKSVKRVVPQMGIDHKGELVEPPKKNGMPYQRAIRYKVDFMVIINDSNNSRIETKIAIEVDGFDFHSSKADKKRDDQRNLFLLKSMILPVHFPASVVQEDPKQVIDQVLYIGRKWNRYFKSLLN